MPLQIKATYGWLFSFPDWKKMNESNELWQFDTVIRLRTRFDETVDASNLPTLQSLLDMIASRPDQFCVGSTNRVSMKLKGGEQVDLLVQMEMVLTCNGEVQVQASAPSEAEMLDAVETPVPAPAIVLPDELVSQSRQ